MVRVKITEGVVIFFFFSSRRRHTRYWRDWSSDVCSSDLADPREVDPRPGAAAEDAPFLGVPVEDRLHRVLDAEDEAGAALRLLLEADVEPDGRVERRHLVQEDVGQLRLEGVAVLHGREVAALAAPVGDGARDAGDHLLDRALARRRAELAAEVLLGHDVGRVLRPGRGELDALLLERDA